MFTTVEKVIFLQNVEVFAAVSTEHLAYIAAIAAEVSYLKNETVYQLGQPSNALYLVLEGKIRLHREEEEIATAGPREAFGTWALFDDEPRLTTATAMEDSRLLRVDREEFFELLSDHTEVNQAVLKHIAGRMRSLVERVGPGPAARRDR